MSRISQPLRVALLAAGAALAVQASTVFGQSTANPPVGKAAADSPTSMQPEAAGSKNDADTAASSHSTRTADAKAARAKNKAELSKLEKNGYDPSSQQADYPNNIQNAEKKANGQ
jgi:hypothetical protein